MQQNYAFFFFVFPQGTGISEEVFRQIETVQNRYDSSTAAAFRAVQKSGEMVVRTLDPRQFIRLASETAPKINIDTNVSIKQIKAGHTLPTRPTNIHINSIVLWLLRCVASHAAAACNRARQSLTCSFYSNMSEHAACISSLCAIPQALAFAMAYIQPERIKTFKSH